MGQLRQIVRIGRPHDHGFTSRFESTHSGDWIQKVADSVTQSAGFVWIQGQSGNISFRIQAIQAPCGRALRALGVTGWLPIFSLQDDRIPNSRHLYLDSPSTKTLQMVC